MANGQNYASKPQGRMRFKDIQTSSSVAWELAGCLQTALL